MEIPAFVDNVDENKEYKSANPKSTAYKVSSHINILSRAHFQERLSHKSR